MNADESKRTSEVHLTDEQFSSLLLSEELDLGARAHLGHCLQCQQEVEAFGDSVNLVGKTTLAWIEAKSPRRSLLPLLRTRQRRLVYFPAAFALATILLILVGMLTRRHEGSERSEPSVAQTAAGDSPAQVAEDNHLLESVNLVLSSNQGSPLPESRFAEYTTPVARKDLRLK